MHTDGLGCSCNFFISNQNVCSLSHCKIISHFPPFQLCLHSNIWNNWALRTPPERAYLISLLSWFHPIISLKWVPTEIALAKSDQRPSSLYLLWSVPSFLRSAHTLHPQCHPRFVEEPWPYQWNNFVENRQFQQHHHSNSSVVSLPTHFLDFPLNILCCFFHLYPTGFSPLPILVTIFCHRLFLPSLTAVCRHSLVNARNSIVRSKQTKLDHIASNGFFDSAPKLRRGNRGKKMSLSRLSTLNFVIWSFCQV